MTMGEINHPEWYPPCDPVPPELERRIEVCKSNIADVMKSIDHLAVMLRKHIETGSVSNALLACYNISEKAEYLSECETKLACYKAALKLIENTRRKAKP